jgi:transketolase C-terminal domain/subunit
MKHCLLPVAWLTRTGKQCFSKKFASFTMRRKQWHTRRQVAKKACQTRSVGLIAEMAVVGYIDACCDAAEAVVSLKLQATEDSRVP